MVLQGKFAAGNEAGDQLTLPRGNGSARFRYEASVGVEGEPCFLGQDLNPTAVNVEASLLAQNITCDWFAPHAMLPLPLWTQVSIK